MIAAKTILNLSIKGRLNLNKHLTVMLNNVKQFTNVSRLLFKLCHSNFKLISNSVKLLVKIETVVAQLDRVSPTLLAMSNNFYMFEFTWLLIINN